MGDLELVRPGPTAPRATHEFRLEEAARERGHGYVRYRDGDAFHAVALIPSPGVVYVGRDIECAVRIQNDDRVSRRHVRLTFGAGQWSIEDGPSRNGTFLESRRITREEILSNNSIFTVGRTQVSFHLPTKPSMISTVFEQSPGSVLAPTPTQHRVLVELARPFLDRQAEIPIIPTNRAIAEALDYEIATIRDAISDLYHQAGLRRGVDNQRPALVRLAIREGVVAPHHLALSRP